jgi:hypothetical protein
MKHRLFWLSLAVGLSISSVGCNRSTPFDNPSYIYGQWDPVNYQVTFKTGQVDTVYSVTYFSASPSDRLTFYHNTRPLRLYLLGEVVRIDEISGEQP